MDERMTTDSGPAGSGDDEARLLSERRRLAYEVVSGNDTGDAAAALDQVEATIAARERDAARARLAREEADRRAAQAMAQAEAEAHAAAVRGYEQAQALLNSDLAAVQLLTEMLTAATGRALAAGSNAHNAALLAGEPLSIAVQHSNGTRDRVTGYVGWQLATAGLLQFPVFPPVLRAPLVDLPATAVPEDHEAVWAQVRALLPDAATERGASDATRE